MSIERSSSAVRNLRSIFETKAPESSPDTRGRSSSGLTSEQSNGSRPTSKVRASFVSVEPPGTVMAATVNGDGAGMAELKRESSAGVRRGSFSESRADDANLLDLKKTVSGEAERRENDSSVAEAIPEAVLESAAVTPMVKAEDHQEQEPVEESPLARKDVKLDDVGQEEKTAANPDKPTTGAEEEPAQLRPADPKDEAAVSGGEALPAAEDLRPNGAHHSTETDAASKSLEQPSATKQLESASKSAKQSTSKPATNGKLSSISTKPSAKTPSTSLKSPASQPKTPVSAKHSTTSNQTLSPKSTETSRKSIDRKASRSSLTAPTAASVARSAASDRSASGSTKQSPPSKHNKPREGHTKPVDLPSRLTAPTAASRAKHENAPADTKVNGKTTTASRPKPQTASARPTPRTSLARPESRQSQASRKPASHSEGGSFLERMMRPTAASASKVHDKVEPKSPPRTSKTSAPAPGAKGKANGHLKKPVAAAASTKGSRPSTAKSSGTEKQALEQDPTHDEQRREGGEDIEELVDEAKEAADQPNSKPEASNEQKKNGEVDEPTGKRQALVDNEANTPYTNGHADTEQSAAAGHEASKDNAVVGEQKTFTPEIPQSL